MRVSVLIIISSFVFMVIGFALAFMPGSIIAAASIFIIGLLIGILGLVMVNRDIESLIVKLEVSETKPSPEDIKKRPVRRPRKG